MDFKAKGGWIRGESSLTIPLLVASTFIEMKIEYDVMTSDLEQALDKLESLGYEIDV